VRKGSDLPGLGPRKEHTGIGHDRKKVLFSPTLSGGRRGTSRDARRDESERFTGHANLDTLREPVGE